VEQHSTDRKKLAEQLRLEVLRLKD